MLQQILPAELFPTMLVFVRVGATMMLMPGIGETYVSPRLRLGAAVAMTLLIAPFVAATVPPLPAGALALTLLIGNEAAIGIFIGLTARLIVTALQVAGTVIAFQSGLGFGLFYDPTQGSQGALISSFFTILGLVMIFASDLHLLVLQAAADSYVLFPPAALPPLGGFVETGVRLIGASFALGVRIAAPFIVFGLVFYVGLGVLNRLMPQVQVTFLAMPLQIAASFILLMLAMGAAMLWFLDHFEAGMATLLAP